MLRTSLAALVVLTLCACSSASRDEKGSIASPADDAAIRSCFEGYRKALLRGDGAAALAFVDVNTLDYYGAMLDLARRGDEQTVRGLSSVNKLVILMLRHRVARDVVLAATAESVFIHAVDRGWVGKDSVGKVELGTIRVRDATATAAIIGEGKQLPLSFTFYREAAGWKIDLTSFFPVVELEFKPLLAKIGPTEDAALLTLLEAMSGSRVSEQIWQPLQ